MVTRPPPGVMTLAMSEKPAVRSDVACTKLVVPPRVWTVTRTSLPEIARALLTPFVAGDPLPYDTKVKEWKYWVANIREEQKPDAPLPDADEDVARSATLL